MAHFCNQFDKVCTEVGCAVIYCHHHSKGAQGGKRSMDRASGSGVFARDPDALLDMTELEVTDALTKQQQDKAFCTVCETWLRRFLGEEAFDRLCSDRFDPEKIRDTAHRCLHDKSYSLCMKEAEAARQAVLSRTAWRIEGTLREFPRFPPLNVWFDYPVHKPDSTGVLQDCEAEAPTWTRNFPKKRSNKERQDERKEGIETAFSAVAENGECSITELAEYLGVTDRTVRNHLKEHGNFWIEDSKCGYKK